jgi:hypothetical protein
LSKRTWKGSDKVFTMIRVPVGIEVDQTAKTHLGNIRSAATMEAPGPVNLPFIVNRK